MRCSAPQPRLGQSAISTCLLNCCFKVSCWFLLRAARIELFKHPLFVSKPNLSKSFQAAQVARSQQDAAPQCPVRALWKTRGNVFYGAAELHREVSPLHLFAAGQLTKGQQLSAGVPQLRSSPPRQHAEATMASFRELRIQSRIA